MTKVRYPSVSPDSGELTLLHRGHELVGTSVAALATAFCIDSLGVAVDMGRCSAVLAVQNHVLLTHCHSDHVAGLVAWLSAHTRRFQGATTRIILPADRRDALLQALQIWPELDGVRRRVDLTKVLEGARAGDRTELESGVWAQAFDVHHSVPSVGWAIGTDQSDRPLFAFAGDGTVEPFTRHPATLDAEIAIVDCSFVDPGTRVAARLGGHGHLQDWIELHPRLRCDILVLAHLPANTVVGDITDRLAGLTDEGPTVIPWLDPDRR
jgi:ribonuclease Z